MGTLCSFAGTGATIAIEGMRLNYTCGSPEIGLFGDFDTSNPLWTATRIQTSGPPTSLTIVARDTPGSQLVIGQPAAQPQPTPSPVPQPAPERFRAATDA